MTEHLLVFVDLTPNQSAHLEQAGFELHRAPTPAERAVMIPNVASKVRAVLTNGSTGITADEIAALPHAGIICALGAGFEKIDVGAAKARGITVTHGPGTNDASVADHAMTLLMAVARGVPQMDAAVRRGAWKEARQARPMISGKKLGILGLGHIGAQIARRGAGGFEMPVAYHSRRRREDVPYLYCKTPAELAAWCDFLVVATPGGAATTHLVSADVLAALGPKGFLINIARGSVVDTVALIDALKHHRIAGAALDVVEGEPNVPADLLACDNLVMTPHMGGRSPEGIAATIALVVDNLAAHFAGRPVLTPVPPRHD